MMISLSDYANSLTDTYTGSGNNGKPIILEGGLKWQPFGFNLRDAEFLGGKTSSKKIYAKF